MNEAEPQTHDPRVEQLTREGKIYIVRDHLAAVIHVALLLSSARTFLWFNAWLLGGIVLAIKVASAVTLVRVNPAVLNARGTKREMSRRERLFFAVLVPSSFAAPLVAGFDVGAPGWTYPSLVELGLGVALAVIGGVITIRALAVNAFFEPTVRLQTDRDQRVCSAGPYRFVRHPGYIGAFMVQTSIPLITGSRWTWVVVAVQLVAFVVRTRYEDRMLREELPGYAEYAERTRARLIPGLW